MSWEDDMNVMINSLNALNQANIGYQNLELQQDIADQNFSLQNDQYDYQKRLNTLLMQREDSAFQRQVADLQKAGLSPLNISGNGASANALNPGQVPQYDGSGISEAYNSLIQVAQQRADARMRLAEFRHEKMSRNKELDIRSHELDNLLKQTEFSQKAESTRLGLEAEQVQANVAKTNAETSKITKETEYNEKYGWREKSLQSYLVSILGNVIGDEFEKDPIGTIRDLIQKNKVDRQEKNTIIDKVVDDVSLDTDEKTKLYNSSKELQKDFTLEEFKKLSDKDLKTYLYLGQLPEWR